MSVCVCVCVYVYVFARVYVCGYVRANKESHVHAFGVIDLLLKLSHVEVVLAETCDVDK